MSFLKAIIIGISFTIPGVCSALVSMLLNSYDDMLEVIGEFYSFKTIKKNKELILGIISGVILGIIGISYVFERAKAPLICVFLGFSIGGFFNLYHQITKKKKVDLMIIMLGLLISLLPELLIQKSTNNLNIIIISLGGFLSSLAFILPGISGSLMLVSFGIYESIINSFSDIFKSWYKYPNSISIIVCLIFSITFILGAVFFSKITKKMVKKYSDLFVKFCLGLLIGSTILLGYQVICLDLSVLFKMIALMSGLLVMKIFG